MAQPTGYGQNLGFSRVGLGTSVVGTAYEQEVLLLAQPNLPFLPYARLNFAPGAKKGETLVFNIASDITAGGALTAGTPIPLNTFSFQPIGMRLKEYGNGLSWDSSWDELFSYTSNANLFRQQLANDYSKVVNTQFLTTLDTAATTICSFAVGSVSERASASGTVGSYQIGTYMVHEMRRIFESNNVPKFPGPNGGYWVWAGHPTSFEFLRRSDAFTSVNLHAADRGHGNMLYTGADAWMYDGFLFLPTTTCTTSTSINGGTSFAFGMDAFGMGIGQGFEVKYEDDYATDFGRMKAVAWMGVLSFGLLYGGSQTGVTPRIWRATHLDN